MGFEKVQTLETDNTISLGGKNKKTNKLNPTRVEGFYLGSRKVADAKKKSGFSFIHVFQTSKGNIGVWGKTHMDNQLQVVEPGTMTRVTATGKTRTTKNGDMILFEVEVDSANTIEVANLGADDNNQDDGQEADMAEGYASSDDDSQEAEAEAEEAPEAIAPPPTAKSNADRNARVQSLLGNKRK